MMVVMGVRHELVTVAWATACAACGRFGFDPHGASDDAAHADGPAGPMVDAPVLHLDAGQCPAGYQFITTSCFRKSTAPASWTGGETLCEADAIGAHLAVIESDPERLEVASLGLANDMWIGTSKRQSPYKTVIDTDGFLDWGPGMGETSEDCVGFGDDSLMYLHSCTDNDIYFCEYDGIPAVPSAF